MPYLSYSTGFSITTVAYHKLIQSTGSNIVTLSDKGPIDFPHYAQLACTKPLAQTS
jgi:hypothetical protein